MSTPLFLPPSAPPTAVGKVSAQRKQPVRDGAGLYFLSGSETSNPFIRAVNSARVCARLCVSPTTRTHNWMRVWREYEALSGPNSPLISALSPSAESHGAPLAPGWISINWATYSWQLRLSAAICYHQAAKKTLVFSTEGKFSSNGTPSSWISNIMIFAFLSKSAHLDWLFYKESHMNLN